MSHHFPLFDGSRLNARRRTRSLKRHSLLVISRYYYAQKPRHTHILFVATKFTVKKLRVCLYGCSACGELRIEIK